MSGLIAFSVKILNRTSVWLCFSYKFRAVRSFQWASFRFLSHFLVSHISPRTISYCRAKENLVLSAKRTQIWLHLQIICVPHLSGFSLVPLFLFSGSLSPSLAIEQILLCQSGFLWPSGVSIHPLCHWLKRPLRQENRGGRGKSPPFPGKN